MKIILKYIFTNVKERKTRTAVMLLSILLSTTLLFVSFSIGASYESAQRKMARGMAGSATLSVSAVDGGIDFSVLPELSSISAGVGMLESSALYHENGYYETIDLIAADLTQLDQINPPRLANGGEITDFTGNQVILPDRFTSKYGMKAGDTITLQIGGQPITLGVAGIAAYDTVFLRHTRGATALLPLSCALSRTANDSSMNSMHLERLTWKPTGSGKRYMMRSWYRQRISMPLLPHRLNRYKVITRQG